MKVRPFDPADAKPCCNIAREDWEKELGRAYPATVVARYASAYVPERFIAHAQRPDVQVLVIEDRGKVAGFVSLYIPLGSPRAEIWRFFVDRASRGHGYGKALLTAAEEYLRDRGVNSVYTESVVLPETLGFYEGQGFVSLGSGLQGEAEIVKLEKNLK